MPAFRRFVRNMTGLEAKGAAVDPDEVCHAAVSQVLSSYISAMVVMLSLTDVHTKHPAKKPLSLHISIRYIKLPFLGEHWHS